MPEKTICQAKAHNYSARFQRFLEVTGHPFSVKDHCIRLVSLPLVIYRFLPDGISLQRPNNPERKIPYASVNFDRLLHLAQNS
jgi:hypothetical protein